jgi:hypothetical protein
MRREQSPWYAIREETQKSRASFIPRQDLCHYLNKCTNRLIEREEHHPTEKKLINANFEDQASVKNPNKQHFKQTKISSTK